MSTRITSPTLTNSGTATIAPVSSVAGLVTFDTVSPFTPGSVVDKTFRAGEKMPRIHTEVINVSFLYNDGADVHLMNAETFDQIALSAETLRDELQYMRENDTVQLLTVDGKPSSLQLPAAVELKVVDTEPGVKGDTVSNVTKPATLETGAIVAVPLFVNVGDVIRVDTREARYISRA